MTQFPFIASGRLTEQGGAHVTFGGETVNVACSVWPSGKRTGAAGTHYDHTGEADRAWAGEMMKPNRALEVDGVTYKIIECVPHDFLPHCALRLRSTKDG